MRARLKTLLDELRGGAWPSSARAVRCPVKSGNERDLDQQLPADPIGVPGTLLGLPQRNVEEGPVHGRSVCPDSPGLHAGYNGADSGYPTPKGAGNL